MQEKKYVLIWENILYILLSERGNVLQIIMAFSSKEYVDSCLQYLSKIILHLVGHGQLEG